MANETWFTPGQGIQPVDNARAYQGCCNVSGGPRLAATDSTQAHRIVLDSLMPGTTGTVQSRAVGDATGYSNWCGLVSPMAR